MQVNLPPRSGNATRFADRVPAIASAAPFRRLAFQFLRRVVELGRERYQLTIGRLPALGSDTGGAARLFGLAAKIARVPRNDPCVHGLCFSSVTGAM